MTKPKAIALNRRTILAAAGCRHRRAGRAQRPARADPRDRGRGRGKPQALGRDDHRADLREEVQGCKSSRGHALAGEPREDAEEQGQAISLRRPDGRPGDDPRRQGRSARADHCRQGSERREAQARHRPHGRHVGNYLQPWQGIAYNTKRMQDAAALLGRPLRSEVQAPHILPSLQNTEGMPNLFMASHLATGKPMAEAQRTPRPASRSSELKPNLLTVYAQMPQAFNLLEQGEAI